MSPLRGPLRFTYKSGTNTFVSPTYSRILLRTTHAGRSNCPQFRNHVSVIVYIYGLRAIFLLYIDSRNWSPSFVRVICRRLYFIKYILDFNQVKV